MKKRYKVGVYAAVTAAAVVFFLNCEKVLGKILVGVILILAVIGSLLEPAEKTLPVSAVESAVGLDLSSGTVLENVDTHGGFHGDGEAYMMIRFPDGALQTQIGANGYWKPLPLTENLSAALYGSNDGHTSRAPMWRDENGGPITDKVVNGYYFFLDRHDQSTDPTDDAQLFTRASYNFTLAVYDTDTHTLYYFELDT